LSVGQSLGDFQGAAIEIERRGVLLGGTRRWPASSRHNGGVVREQDRGASLGHEVENLPSDALSVPVFYRDGPRESRQPLVLVGVLLQEIAGVHANHGPALIMRLEHRPNASALSTDAKRAAEQLLDRRQVDVIAQDDR
jgi:hypothetical protein